MAVPLPFRESEVMAGRNIKITGFLTQIDAPRTVKEFQLFGSEMQLGRNKKCDIRIPGVNVSRHHCSFSYSPEDGWSIADNGSQNGTFLNMEQLPSSVPVKLKDYDVIHLGNPIEKPQAFIFREVPPDEEHIIVYPKQPPITDIVIETNSNVGLCNEIRNANPSINLGSKRQILTENSNAECNKKFKSMDNDAKACCSKDLNCNTHENKVASSSKDSISIDLKPMTDGLDKEVNDSCALLDFKPVSTDSKENLNVGSDVSPMSAQQKASTSSQNVTQRTDSESMQNRNKNGECSKSLNTADEAEDNSQSLLATEKDDFFGSDPYPFSQPLDEELIYNEENAIHNPASKENVSIKQEADNQATEIALLREKIASLKAENEALEKSRSELQRILRENNDILSKHLSEEKKLKEHLEMCEENIKENFTSHLVKRLEEELSCNICTELLMKATVLDCSHTFCEYCIAEWMKKKKQCPICRNKITSETKVLVLDHFIDKAVELLSPSHKEKRKEILDKRKVEKKPPPKRKKGRGRRPNTRNNTTTTTAPHFDEAIENYVDALAFIEDMQDRFESDDDGYVNFALDSDVYSDEGSSSPVEGNGYYGGYGRCFNCGRTGHWANGCPGI